MTRALHDGRDDGLQPLESLDLQNTQGFADLLQRMSKTAFGGRELGEAFAGPAGHGRRPRLHPRADHFRGHEHRQDGAGRLPDDRCRPGADHHFHRGHHGPRPVGGHRLRPLQARPQGLRQAALRLGLQPRLRHAGDGVESLACPAGRQPGRWRSSIGRSRSARRG